MIEKSLVLSTANVPSMEPQFGLTENKSSHPRVAEHEYGWIVFVDRNAICADWFKPIMERAIKEDCSTILFDSDANICEDFQKYDW